MNSSQQANDPGVQPGLGIVLEASMQPYRVHLHQRIANEIPQLKLHTIMMRLRENDMWGVDSLPESINPVALSRQSREDTAGARKNWLAEWELGGKALSYIEQNNIKAVVVLGYYTLGLLRVIRGCAKRGIPVFVRGDSNVKGETGGNTIRQRVKRRLLRWVIKCATGVMPMGRLGQAYFEYFGAKAEDCFWVPYEPDYTLFQQRDAQREQAFRDKHNLPNDKRFILYCGRMVSVKRVDLLIDAFARIAEQRPDWNLLMAGCGILEGDLRARVPADQAHRVHWIGFQPIEELRTAYHVADVMVLPSDYEPWALVINEAVASGLVVVASDVVGAAYEMVEDGKSGRIFSQGDLAGLTKALADVTDAAAIEQFRVNVPAALERWRQTADPVEGIRAALRHVTVLSDAPAKTKESA